ncbi:hypothetical protein IEQ11_17880 [Lysobacter capsici]|uniref:hypothetical protein n=1 Tax=Lysobacter capsici TaxID=435897 RepID=UPI00177F702D|nr:hypothetical protein [Lysobacter capsici]UOF13604.1 hypothetical protein IEQ11_17880 [Lysobacter capsici]
MNDPIASLIARLLAERWLPRDDVAVRDLLTDAELRNDLDRRLAAAGMRLLEHPYAANIAVGIARPQESAVFGSAKAWSSTNLQLDRDAIALLVVLWALLVLPKRQRQIARQQADRDQDQEQMFAELKPVPVGAEVVEPINERTLLADFAEKLGGKTRIQFNLGSLARQGFIVRRKERIHEGPLLDLALDYERIAGRVMDGALSFVVAEARHYSADNPELEGETEAEAQADAALLADIEAGIYSDLDTYAQTHGEPGIGSGESGIGAVFDDGDGDAMDPLPPLQADEIADDEVGAFAAESGDAEAIAVSDDTDATDANPDTPSKQNQEAAADV